MANYYPCELTVSGEQLDGFVETVDADGEVLHLAALLPAPPTEDRIADWQTQWWGTRSDNEDSTIERGDNTAVYRFDTVNGLPLQWVALASWRFQTLRLELWCELPGEGGMKIVCEAGRWLEILEYDELPDREDAGDDFDDDFDELDAFLDQREDSSQQPAGHDDPAAEHVAFLERTMIARKARLDKGHQELRQMLREIAKRNDADLANQTLTALPSSIWLPGLDLLIELDPALLRRAAARMVANGYFVQALAPLLVNNWRCPQAHALMALASTLGQTVGHPALTGLINQPENLNITLLEQVFTNDDMLLNAAALAGGWDGTGTELLNAAIDTTILNGRRPAR